MKAPKALAAIPAPEQPAAEAIEAAVAAVKAIEAHTNETPASAAKGAEAQASEAVAIAATPALSAEEVTGATTMTSITTIEATQIKVKEGMEKAMKTAEEFVTFSQGNVEAFVKSGQIWANGIQDLSKTVAAAAQASVEDGISTFKALTSVKSLKEVFDLQTAFARSALEKTMAESGRLTDASFKLTEQALAPLTARVTVAVEKFSKTA